MDIQNLDMVNQGKVWVSSMM